MYFDEGLVKHYYEALDRDVEVLEQDGQPLELAKALEKHAEYLRSLVYADFSGGDEE